MTVTELKAMSLEQKKALAYDLIALGEQTQRNLQVVNQAIAEDQKPKEEVKEAEVV